jgi:sulfur carrier protein ThiS
MSARIILRKNEYEVKHGISIRTALEKLGIQSESVIPIKDNELVTDDEIIQEGDIIQLVAVISGG